MSIPASPATAAPETILCDTSFVSIVQSSGWLSMTIIDECARLRALCRRSGTTVPDNDIWISATANTRGWPLVSCDKHFDAILDVDHIRLDPP